MRHFRRTAVLATAAVGALLLAGCSSSAENSADDGEALVVYSGRSESLVGPVLEQFSEDTGIEVEVRYGDTSGMAAQLLEEGDRSPADVFLAQDAGALGAVADAGLFAPLPAETVAVVPEQYRGADDLWTAVTGRARVLVYDPEQVSEDELPESVFELTGEEWRGKVAIAPGNASFQSFVTAMRVSAGEEAAQQWIEDMAANDPQLYEKNGLILDAVDAGQVPLGLINHYYWFEKAAEVGEENMPSRLAYTAPGDPGSLVNVSGVGLLAGSADNPDAQALIDYLLSDAGQTYFAQETLEYPMVASVPPAAELVPLDQLQGPQIDLGDLASLPVTVEYLQSAGLL